MLACFDIVCCHLMSSSLLPELRHRILKLLPPNEVALSGRLTCKDAAESLADPGHCTVRLREPLPDYADPQRCIQYSQSSFCDLTFHGRLRATSVAAASGSEANMSVAWGLLKPCLFEELCPGANSVPPLHYASASWFNSVGWVDAPPLVQEDPGSAAVKAGHVHLLPWLLRNCVPLDPQRTLNAAAEHCDLAGLQSVWDLLSAGPPGCSGRPYYSMWAFKAIRAAARSQPPDSAAAKVKWLCEKNEDTEQSHLEAAVGAAEAGDVGLFLRWPLRRHLHMLALGDSGYAVLAAALQHFSEPEAVDWLLDEEGFMLPGDEEAGGLLAVWKGAAASGNVDMLRWLADKMVPLPPEQLQDDEEWDEDVQLQEDEHGQGRGLGELLVAAAKSGQVGAVRYLHVELGLPLTEQAFCAAVGSGSVPLAAWLLQAGCPMGPAAYVRAAAGAHVGMVRWLAEEARCPFEQDTVSSVIHKWPEHPEGGDKGAASGSGGGSGGGSDDLLKVVKLLLDAGCPLGEQDVGLDADGPFGQQDDALTNAVWRGDLPLVRYLHEERGVAFGDRTLARAADNGSEAMLGYLWAAGCVPHGRSSGGSPAQVTEPYAVAGSNGDLGTLRCLKVLGVPWDATWAIERARRLDCTLPVLRWFVEQGAGLERENAVRELVQATAREWLRGSYRQSVEWFMSHPAVGSERVMDQRRFFMAI